MTRAEERSELAHAQHEPEGWNAELTAFYENAPIGCVVLDEDARVRLANREAGRMLGRLTREVVGRPLTSFCVDDSADELRRHCVRVRDGDTRRTVEVRIARPDGEQRWLRVLSRRAREGGSRTVLVDVTEERRERRRAERTARSEALGRVAAGISHDFRNLLMGIIGCADMALEHLGPSHPARRAVETLQTAARDGSDMATQLVALGRQDQEGFEPVDLNRVIRRSELLLDRLVGPAVRLELRFSSEPAICLCPPGVLEHLLMNLAANARDAMPHGGRLIVQTALVPAGDPSLPATDPAPHVRLTVTDTGEGMAADTLEHLFEPYYSTKRGRGGSGLGLAMVHATVRRLRGHIDVWSELGTGSTFSLLIPRAPSITEPYGVLTEQTNPQVALPPARDAHTVLLVEDDELVRMASRYYLEKAGYRVVEAASVADGTARAAEDPPAVVLADMVLPDGGGDQLASTLRIRGGPPVIFVSAHPRSLLLAHRRIEESDSTLTKPFDERSLLAAVAAAVQANLARGPDLRPD